MAVSCHIFALLNRMEKGGKKGCEKMKKDRTLDSISVGERLYITRLDITAEESVRLRDLGLLVGREVRSVGESPLGDPVMLVAGGRVIAARRRDLRSVLCGAEEILEGGGS